MKKNYYKDKIAKLEGMLAAERADKMVLHGVVERVSPELVGLIEFEVLLRIKTGIEFEEFAWAGRATMFNPLQD